MLNSLVDDLKSGLESYFYKVDTQPLGEDVVVIRGKSEYYKKYEDIMMILNLKPIIIHYYDKRFEKI